MPDLPDWYQGFQLVGSDITINVNIEASAATLPVSIDAATVTLDVNLTAATATIDIVFTDQSVAVFDAAKWFAHGAEQIFVTASVNASAGSLTVIASRTVPTGKVFMMVGVSMGLGGNQQPYSMRMLVRVGGTYIMRIGSFRGFGTPFDVPLRVEAEQLVELVCAHYGSVGAEVLDATLWGYDEEA